MKHIGFFENVSDYESVKGEFEFPTVSYTQDNDTVRYMLNNTSEELPTEISLWLTDVEGGFDNMQELWESRYWLYSEEEENNRYHKGIEELRLRLDDIVPQATENERDFNRVYSDNLLQTPIKNFAYTFAGEYPVGWYENDDEWICNGEGIVLIFWGSSKPNDMYHITISSKKINIQSLTMFG